jgi:folylpolyglutamate synthase/dihydropteroate synthase
VKDVNKRLKVPLIVAPQKPVVLKEIKRRRLGVPVVYVGGGDANFEAAMAALVNMARRDLIDEFDEKLFLKIYHHLAIMGRFDIEKINVGTGRALREKVVIFDIAHTAGSAQYLREKLDREFPGQKFVFLISMMKDKDVDGFLDELVGKDVMSRFRTRKHKVYFTNSHPVRGHDAGELRRRFYKEAKVVPDPIEAFQLLLKKMKKDQVMVVTGSHFLVGSILRLVKRRLV